MEKENLERFLLAQNAGNSYARALQEIRNGKKLSHWIWYIFPQMRGLGRSGMSMQYGIVSLSEAKAYLENPTLKARLYEILRALLEHSDKSAESILGGVDAVKVRSCMTLFNIVSPNDVFKEVLDTFYCGRCCKRTLQILGMAPM